MTHTLIYTGAPESSNLDWNEKSLLPVKPVEVSANDPLQSPPRASVPKWRQLEMERLKMRPILPKLELDQLPKESDLATPADFLDSSELASQDLATEAAGSDVSAEDSRPSLESNEPETEALADFYEHSFSIHEAIPSSQISDSLARTPGTPIYESSEEMFPDLSGAGGIIRTPSQRRLSQAPKPKNLMNLAEIPNANFLRSIEPQTKTLNLIVGVISISEPRLVTTGLKWNKPKKVEVVELLVGDDTKSSFSITMWMPREMHVNWKDGAQEKPEGSRSFLRRSLKFIRPRDIILVQNVALGSFRGKVHGQSLRGDVTKIDLLFRKKVDEEDLQGCYTAQNLRMAIGKDPQILKVKRVRDWLADFVGEAPEMKKKKGKASRLLLPDDTQ